MYKLSKEAAKDVDNILSYTMTNFGLEKADTYFQSLSDCLQLLGDNPQMGKSIDKLRKGYRCFQHENHSIFYIPREQNVLIVRILHVQMDALSHLLVE